MNVQDWPSPDKETLFLYLKTNSYRSERHKLFYVATPKAACTSLKWWFADLEGCAEALRLIADSLESDPDLVIHDSFHKVAPEVTRLCPEALLEPLTSDAYFRYAVVRNPYSRIFSAWQSKLLLREPLQVAPYLKCGFLDQPVEKSCDIAAAFEGFLEHLTANEAPHFWDVHWTPQATLLRPDLIRYSQWVKIEKPEELSRALSERLGSRFVDPFSVRYTNESLIPYLPEYITKRSSELIPKLYAADFELFGYSTQPPESRDGLSREQLGMAIKAISMIRGRNQRLTKIRASFSRQLSDQKQAIDTGVSQINSLSQAVAGRDGRIAGLSQAVSERDGKIAGLSQAVSERDGKIAGLSQTVSERDGKIAGLSQAVSERDEKIAGLDRAVSEREGRIAGLEQSMTERDRLLSERNGQIASLKNTLSAQEEQAKTLREELQGIYRSVTWNVLLKVRRLVPRRMRDFVVWILAYSKLKLSDAPSVKRSGLFDPGWYLAKYPDVAKAGVDPIEHYLKWGGFEGRFPSPDFDSEWYLNEYPDVVQAGVNPLAHYIRSGKKEGRKALSPSSFPQSLSGVVYKHTLRPIPFKVREFLRGAEKAVSPVVFMLRRQAADFNKKWNRVEEVGSYGLEVEVPDVSILIPTYGSLGDIEKCLQSMLKYPAKATYEVLILNDKPAKRRDLREWAKNSRPLLERSRSRIFSSSRNVGFASSINALSEKAKGAWLFFLNDDTEICSPRWLDALVDTIQSDKAIGAAGSLLLFSQSNLVNHAGLYPVMGADGKIRNGCYYKYFNRNYPAVNLRRQVPMLTGAALLISRELFMKIGRLDEKYLGAGGFDDSDLSNRLTEMGCKLFYVPESVIFHYEGKTIQKESAHKDRWLMNQRYYSVKWKEFLKRKYGL